MKKNRLVAMLLAVVMTFALTGCTSEIMGFDLMFVMYGWDGIVNGEEVWANKARAEAEAKKAAEEAAKLAGEEVTEETTDEASEEEETEVVTEVVTEKNAKGETVTKVVEKTVTKQSSGGSSSSGSKTNGGSTSGGSTSGGSTSSTTKASGGSTSGGSTTATDALSVFNNAVNAGKPTSCTYSVSNATMTTDSSKVNGLFDASAASGQNGSGKSGNASCFTTISSSDVASSTIKDNGSTYTVTIKLNNAKVAVSAKPAQNGYEYFMDAVTCQSLIRSVNDQMTMLNNGNISLSNGNITATINKSTGKFTSCKLTCNEVYYDGIEIASLLKGQDWIASVLNIDSLFGTFNYDLSVEYAF